MLFHLNCNERKPQKNQKARRRHRNVLRFLRTKNLQNDDFGGEGGFIVIPCDGGNSHMLKILTNIESDTDGKLHDQVTL